MCPKRKEQVDWKIGVKHCPRGHRNHLDEDYCIECDYPFGDNPVRHRPRPWRFRSWTALAVLLGLLVSSLVFGITGWRPSAPPKENTELVSRILKLERKVGWLEGQVRSQAMILDELNTKPAAKPTTKSAPTYKLTPVPSDSVLVVVVANGNVRAGPSTNHEVIGAVKAGDIIERPLGRDKNGWYRYCCVKGGQFGWLGPIVVKEQNKSGISPTKVPTKAPAENNQSSITSPPSHLGVSPIYTKYLNANGAHIVALEDVSSQALKQAKDILHGMVSVRPELLTAMTANGLLIILFDSHTTSLSDLPEFNEWNVAGQHAGGYALKGDSHTVAAPEQNLRCSGILTHEIGHAVEYVMDNKFGASLDAAYQNAKAKGNWIEPYAATNKHEYWAVAVSHWFHSANSGSRLAKTDPMASRLVRSAFGPAKLSTQPCH